MQHDNFQNLKRVIFTHWKHLESRVNAFWYCFPAIKRYTFHYLMKQTPILGNQSSFEILQLFDIWHYQSFVILFFSSAVIFNLRWVRWCLSCIAGQSYFRQKLTESLLHCRPLFLLIWLNLWNIINEIQHCRMKSLLFFIQFIYQRPRKWLAHSI